MAFIKSSFPYDDSLIISRLQQRELASLKPQTAKLQGLTPTTKFTLDPFIDNLPIKIGLKFKLLGSRILSSRIERDYMYQDLENKLSELSFTEGLKALASLNQRTPLFNQLALAVAMEEIFQSPASKDTKSLRCFLLEYSRIFHHWQVIKNILITINHEVMHDIALTAESLMRASHELLGRIRLASNAMDESIPMSQIREILDVVETLARELDSTVSFDSSVRMLLRKKAHITQNVASSYGLTGPYLRANRNAHDLRTQSGVGYENTPRIELADGGDIWARFVLRIREILASISWIKAQFLTTTNTKALIAPLKEERVFDLKNRAKPFAFGEIDAPEGDVKMGIFFDPKNNRLIYRMRTPAYFIAQALPHLLSQSDIKDLPLILYSLGINAEEIDK